MRSNLHRTLELFDASCRQTQWSATSWPFRSLQRTTVGASGLRVPISIRWTCHRGDVIQAGVRRRREYDAPAYKALQSDEGQHGDGTERGEGGALTSTVVTATASATVAPSPLPCQQSVAAGANGPKTTPFLLAVSSACPRSR